MKVMLGTFLYACLEGHFGPNIAMGIRSSLRHYDRRLRSSSTPVVIPGFVPPEPVDGAMEVEIVVEPELLGRLEMEARRQLVDLRLLVRHAVVVYLADIERDGVGGGRKPSSFALAR